MKKHKRKVIVVLSVVFGIILFAGIGLYVWYSNSLFPTVVKLADAVKERNVDAMMECIEPDTVQKIRLIVDFTGLALDDIGNTKGSTFGTERYKANIGDVSKGSNFFIYTFCTLILYCLLFASDTWHGKLKKPIALETQGLQTKNGPT